MGDHLAGRNGVGVGDDDGAVGRGAAPVRVAGRGQQVEREEHVDTRHAGVVRRRRHLVGDADVARDGSGLLREAGLVEAPHGVAGEHRRRAEDLADGDHARAADAREADGEPGGIDDRRRLREIADVDLAGRRAGALLTGGVSRHRGERRAVALHAREVEVAARLVDAGLATERRVDRLHREAVALGAAVATALADPFVDDDPEVGAWRACRGCGPVGSRPRTPGRGSAPSCPGSRRAPSAPRRDGCGATRRRPRGTRRRRSGRGRRW